MLKIKTDEFINRIIKRGLKQFHLDELFEYSIVEYQKIPATIKSEIKKSADNSFFDGGTNEKAKYIFMKLKQNISISPEEAKLKFINFIKANILIDKHDSNIIDPSVAIFYIDNKKQSEDDLDDVQNNNQDKTLFMSVGLRFD